MSEERIDGLILRGIQTDNLANNVSPPLRLDIAIEQDWEDVRKGGSSYDGVIMCMSPPRLH